MAADPLLLPPVFNAAAHFIDRHIEEGSGERIAIECEDRRVSYRELFHSVNRVGNALRDLGVRMEERVILLLPDCPEFAFGFFGAIKIGAVPAPLNTMLPSFDYEYFLNSSRASVAIVGSSLVQKIRAIPKENLHYLKHVIVVGFGSSDDGAVSFDDLIKKSSPELDAALTHKDDPAFWLYSSGSTGTPKACVHLHHDMVVCSEHYAKGVLNIRRDDRFFSVSKLFFAYGLGNALYYPFAVGATSILMPSAPKPDAIAAAIKKHRPTIFFSVPTNYAAVLAQQDDGKIDFDFSSVRMAVSAGEALPATIFHRFKENFALEVLDSIGSTETAQAFIANRPGAPRPGSSGQIVPGYEATILDDWREPVKRGEIGDLFIKTDALCAYYWQEHERTKATIEGPWIKTGDKYYQDDDLYFWHVGRTDDMLKCSGMWVSPVEVENILIEHPSVLEVGVIGKEDGDGLIKPAAYIVLREGREENSKLGDDIKAFAAARLPAYKRPQWVIFLRELPRTTTGKLQRFKLRDAQRSAPSAF